MGRYIFSTNGINCPAHLWVMLERLSESKTDLISLNMSSYRMWFSAYVEIEAEKEPDFSKSHVPFGDIENILRLEKALKEGSRVRVIFVDDEKEHFDMTVERCNAELFEFVYAGSVEEMKDQIMQAINGGIPVVILLDIVWDVGGDVARECLREIKEDPKWVYIPTFMVSIHTFKDVQVEAYWSEGAWGYIYKPELWNREIDLREALATLLDIDLESCVISLNLLEGSLLGKLLGVIQRFALELLNVKEIVTIEPKKRLIMKVGKTRGRKPLIEMLKELQEDEIKVYDEEIFNRMNFI